MKKRKNEIKCDVCGFKFAPVADEHYIARADETTGLATVMTREESEIYDAFDCPNCGCQHLVARRFRRCTQQDKPNYKSKEVKEAAECEGGECTYGKFECCRDCEERTICDEACDGDDQKGCYAECASRKEA